MTSLIEAKDVKFSYRKGEPVLRGVSFSVERGDFVAITGPSGSGKSTLFYLLGALVSKYSGEIRFMGRDLRQGGERERALFRNARLGFVFQQFHLLARASVLDNVLLPTYYPFDSSRPAPADRERAMSLLKRLGLGELTARQPQELSGGQQQRVALARALIRDPEVILADEPTGNLDSHSTAVVMDIFKQLHAEGKTIVIITHSPEIAAQCSRVIRFKDGLIEEDKRLSPVRASAGVGAGAPAANVREQGDRSPIMPYLRALKPAWENISRTKAKAALTMLGVILGIGAVLTTMSLGSFAKTKILSSYESLGVNTLTVNGWPSRRRTTQGFAPAVYRSFTWQRDIEPMMQIFREIEAASPVMWNYGSSFNYGGQSLSDDTAAVGVNEQYYRITNQALAKGRTLSVLDIEHVNPVCVIGHDVSQILFGGADNAVNNSLTVVDNQSGEYPCRVVGVLAKTPAQAEGSSPDTQVFMPHTYVERSLTNPWQREIRELRLKIASGFDPDMTGAQIEGFLRSRYGATGDFNSRSNAKVIEQMNLFLNVFSSLLTAVAAIALLVGGVGINNMMLVSLAERLKELGLRKALGANPAQVRALVLTESLVLCALGGMTGLVFGFLGYHGLIYAATKLIPDMTFQWVIEPLAIFASFGAIVVTGILSGMVPALRAERQEVIEALRQE